MRGLKIRTSKGDLLWDSSWTAGVEHEEDAEDRDYESDESDDDDSDTESETSFEEEISPEELHELCNEEGSMDATSTTELSDTTDSSDDEEADEENEENEDEENDAIVDMKLLTCWMEM